MENKQKSEISLEKLTSTPDDIIGVGFGNKISGDSVVDNDSIVFSVKKKKPLDQIPEEEQIPPTIEIDGKVYKTDVIEVHENKLLSWSNCGSPWTDYITTPPTNRNEFRPLKGGISCTNYTNMSGYVGTMGFIAVDNDDGTLVGISNNHVLVNNAFYTSDRNLSSASSQWTNVSGSVCTQPNDSGKFGLSYRIGLVKKYVPIHPLGSGTNTVDVAAISLDPALITSNLINTADSWRQEGIINLVSAPPFANTVEIDAALSDPNTYYYSSGRTTGAKGENPTNKLIKYSSGAAININYTDQTGSGTTVQMSNLFSLVAYDTTQPSGNYCYYPSNGGDSGSAILAEIDGVLKIVGLLFAGSYVTINDVDYPTITWCNRIDEVASQLNISAWDGISTSLASQTVSTKIIAGGSAAPTMNVSGSTYWQVGLVNNLTNPPN